MIARLTPSRLKVSIRRESSPSDNQWTEAAPQFSISGKVSSLIATTTTSAPLARAASSTRKGNFPLPAINPSFLKGGISGWTLLDDAAFRGLNEADEHFCVFTEIGFRLKLCQGLRRIELRCEQDLIGVVNLAN